MSLGERLRRLGALSPDPTSAASAPAPFDATAFLRCLPGFTAEETAHGVVFRQDAFYPADYRRGSFSISGARNVTAAGWNMLLSKGTQQSDGNIQKAVFIDTETTGLGRGTGTYAFLIGIGRYTEAGFVVRQYIMPDYDHESAMMHAVVDELNAATLVFTFNGKSFDGPLLQARAIMNGLRLPLPRHIDLYHLSRRFFSSRARNCSLNQLETDIMHITRDDDVPGYMIPVLYFDYLERGNAQTLIPICEHNILDVLSSAALAAYIGQAVEAPLTAAPNGKRLDGADLYAAGQLYWQREDEINALRCFEAARLRPHPPGLAGTVCQALTTLYKRHHRHDAAVVMWHDMVAKGTDVTAALVELAKHYEHREQNYTKALSYTQRALDYVARYEPVRGKANPSASVLHKHHGHDTLLHRRRRLEKRLQRHGQPFNRCGDPDKP